MAFFIFGQTIFWRHGKPKSAHFKKNLVAAGGYRDWSGTPCGSAGAPPVIQDSRAGAAAFGGLKGWIGSTSLTFDSHEPRRSVFLAGVVGFDQVPRVAPLALRQ